MTNVSEIRSSLPRSVLHGELAVLGDGITAHHLSDGRRALASKEIQRLFATTGSAQSARSMDRILNSVSELTTLPAFKFISHDGSSVISGIEARHFVELCEALKEAAILEKLHQNQRHYAVAALKLTKAWSTIGLEQLMDDATGYRQTAEAQAPGAIIQRFKEVLLEDPSEWHQTFPPKFYAAANKMNRRAVRVGRPALHPSFYRDYVYDVLLGKEVAGELKRRNPYPRKGSNHHQHLTPQAKALLGRYLPIVVTLMNQSHNFDEFKMRFNHEFHGMPLQLSFGETG